MAGGEWGLTPKRVEHGPLFSSGREEHGPRERGQKSSARTGSTAIGATWNVTDPSRRAEFEENLGKAVYSARGELDHLARRVWAGPGELCFSRDQNPAAAFMAPLSGEPAIDPSNGASP